MNFKTKLILIIPRMAHVGQFSLSAVLVLACGAAAGGVHSAFEHPATTIALSRYVAFSCALGGGDDWTTSRGGRPNEKFSSCVPRTKTAPALRRGTCSVCILRAREDSWDTDRIASRIVGRMDFVFKLAAHVLLGLCIQVAVMTGDAANAAPHQPRHSPSRSMVDTVCSCERIFVQVSVCVEV